jgi:hypothetical protein
MPIINKIIAITLFVLFTANTVQAISENDGGFVSIGSFLEEGGERSGGEFSFLSNTSSFFAMRFSGVLYVGRNENDIKDLFGGFSFTGFLHLNQRYINPYLGLGLFLGDTYHCTEEEKAEDECREDGVIAVYPEVGVAFNLVDIQIYPFARLYNFGDDTTYGLNLGLIF